MPRARTYTNEDGQFVHVNDLKAALNDEAFLKECAMMIKVAKTVGHHPLLGVKMCIYCAVDGVTGVTEAQMQDIAPQAEAIFKAGQEAKRGGK